MKFKQIKISNLKNTESKVFDFTDQTLITGANGEGKTTILNALEFALTGKINTNTKLTPYRKAAISYFEVILYVDNHIITRRSTGDVMLNGNGITQEELEATLGFNALEFMSTFGGYFIKFTEEEKARLLNVTDVESVAKEFLTPEQLVSIDLNNLKKETAKAYKDLLAKKKVVEFLSQEIANINNNLITQKALLKDLEKPSVKEYEDKLKELKAEKEKLITDGTKKLEEDKKNLKIKEKELAKIIKDNKKIEKKNDKTKLDIEKHNDKVEKEYKKAYDKEHKAFLESQKPECPHCKKELKGFVKTGSLEMFEFKGGDKLPKRKELVLEEPVCTNTIELEIQALKQSTGVAVSTSEIDSWIASTEKDIANIDEVHNAKVKTIEDNIALYTKNFKAKQDDLVKSDISQLEKLYRALKDDIPATILEKAKAALLAVLPEEYSINLYDVVKSTGEKKYKFKLCLRDVEYQWLSGGEQAMTDVYLSRYFMNKFGYDTLILDEIQRLDSEKIAALMTVDKYIYIRPN